MANESKLIKKILSFNFGCFEWQLIKLTGEENLENICV